MAVSEIHFEVNKRQTTRCNKGKFRGLFFESFLSLRPVTCLWLGLSNGFVSIKGPSTEVRIWIGTLLIVVPMQSRRYL